MITSSLPLRSLSLLLPTTATATTAGAAAYRSPTLATVPFRRVTLGRRHHHHHHRRRRRLAYYSANGSLPGLPPLEEDDDEVCPVDCVTEFKTDEEFMRHLDRSKATGALVVVDFYRTSCGSCKYIERRFIRLCKEGSAGDGAAPVVFLKHNVIDEYDEKSEVADRLRIKVVPMFQFYKDGELVESFATRDKERIIAAIKKYTSPEPETTAEEEVQE